MAAKKKKTPKVLATTTPDPESGNKSEAIRGWLDKKHPTWRTTGKTDAMGTYAEMSKQASKALKGPMTVSNISSIFTQLKKAKGADKPAKKSRKQSPKAVDGKPGRPPKASATAAGPELEEQVMRDGYAAFRAGYEYAKFQFAKR